MGPLLAVHLLEEVHRGQILDELAERLLVEQALGIHERVRIARLVRDGIEGRESFEVEIAHEVGP